MKNATDDDQDTTGNRNQPAVGNSTPEIVISKPSYGEKETKTRKNSARTSVINKPKLCHQSKATEVVAYFKEKCEENGLIDKDIYQNALEKLKDITGRCFNNIIHFLTWYV